VEISAMIDEMDLYGFEDFDDSQKVLLLNEAYLDIVTREPWPFMERVIAINVPTSASKITNNSVVLDPDKTNPTGPITDLGAVLSLIDTTNDIVVVPERADTVEKNYRVLNTSGVSDKYYFVGDDMYLYPATSSATVYRLYYLKTPSDLTVDTDEADILIPKRHHSIIVYGALVKAFLVNDDPQAAVFQNAFESRYQQMRNDVWMNQYDRTERVHIITDSYDWSY
jgi:hypothetical protein